MFILREEERECKGAEREREKERERTPSRLHAISTQASVGLEPKNLETMT